MSPIEQHLAARWENDLRKHGVTDAVVRVLSADADRWRFRISAAHRDFELGFDPQNHLSVTELTPGRARSLVSNDHARLPTSAAARTRALDLVVYALAHPTFPPRDPPVV